MDDSQVSQKDGGDVMGSNGKDNFSPFRPPNEE